MIKFIIFMMMVVSCGMDPMKDYEREKEISELEAELEHEKKKDSLREGSLKEEEETQAESGQTVNIEINNNVGIGNQSNNTVGGKISQGDSRQFVEDNFEVDEVESRPWHNDVLYYLDEQYCQRPGCRISFDSNTEKAQWQSGVSSRFLDLSSW